MSGEFKIFTRLLSGETSEDFSMSGQVPQVFIIIDPIVMVVMIGLAPVLWLILQT